MSEPSKESAKDEAKKGPPPSEPPESGAHDHQDERKYPYVAHHFDSPKQQLEAGKLGMWLFLATEILFFAGLFCAYTIYRAQHPEVFYWAHFFLDTKLGELNTIVLILSSLTAAWAVRNAQLGQKKLLVQNIVITMLCACAFMGIKAVEYSHKAHNGLLPGKHFDAQVEVWQLDTFKKKHPEAAAAAQRIADYQKAKPKVAPPAAKPGEATESDAPKLSVLEKKPLMDAGVLKRTNTGDYELTRPARAHTFFGIYFFMTGLHGFHVLIGIGIWAWLLLRAMKGQFGRLYFGPIDFAALYWHLVDLIWIYLFPLLYLIH
jgi:cytochrome c oxidase subunit 3